MKIDASVMNPLNAYYDDLKRRNADTWGLLVLARSPTQVLDKGVFVYA